MRNSLQSIGRLFGVVVLFAFLSACASAQLAPQYSQSIHDSLNRANAKALSLFASVSGGSSRAQFPGLRSRYDEAIGEFDAVKIAVKARSVPALTASVLTGGALADVCKDEVNAAACVNSTASKLEGIVEVLTEMKRIHGTMGLNTAVIAAYKQDYEISIVSALRIETALKR